MVVRCFADPDVAHVTAELDPLADSEVIDLELILADLATLERREEKVRSMAKAQPREFAAELDLLARMRAHLEGEHGVQPHGHPARHLGQGPEKGKTAQGKKTAARAR